MIKHEAFIKGSYQLAKRAQKKGNHPFGALLVLDSQIILTAENTVITEQDITRHAEMNLISKAAREFVPEMLIRCILYTSTEPCAMCTGAIFWSGISRIVYGCSAELLGEIAGGTFVVPCRDLLMYGNRDTTVIGPILEERGAAIHRSFW